MPRTKQTARKTTGGVFPTSNDIQMPRTKQTARKTTGGVFPTSNDVQMPRTKRTARKTTGSVFPTSNDIRIPRTKQTARKTTGGVFPTSNYMLQPDDGSSLSSFSQIRDQVEALIKSDLGFRGKASYHEKASKAPNPALHIDGIGTIGLPLSKRDAQDLLIPHFTQAPFGKGDQSVVDKKVRNTFEIDAKDVTVLNPAWDDFMNTTVKSVCTKLGVTALASWIPYKLLLYQEGSHFLPHQDTEKVDGMFATVVVVLPSKHTGGAVHVTHGGAKSILDCSANSGAITSVLAWYTDVVHEIKPVTSGYRLALTYNLLHDVKSPRPPLPTTHLVVEEMKKILLEWKGLRAEDNQHNKLTILLDHQYSEVGLKRSMLKGRDYHIAGILERCASDMGFTLGVASLEFGQTGWGDDHWLRPGEEIDESTLSIECAVDLQGHDLDWDRLLEEDDDADADFLREERIPENFELELKKRRPTVEENEG